MSADGTKATLNPRVRINTAEIYRVENGPGIKIRETSDVENSGYRFVRILEISLDKEYVENVVREALGGK